MTTSFNLAHCKTLPFLNAIEYITEYFIPLDDGKFAFNFENKWCIRDEDVIRRVYFNRLSPLLNEYFFKEYDRVLTPIYDKSKPLFYDNYINFDYEEIKLPPHYQFIVDEFIEKGNGLHIKPKELYELYRKFSPEPINKIQFNNEMANASIIPTKSGTNFYKYTFDELFLIGLKNEWYDKDPRDIEIELLKTKIAELENTINEYNVEIEYVEEGNDEIVEDDVEDDVQDDDNISHDGNDEWA